ncbi:di-heme oxidoreductase family protein [Marinobacterium weihaiense]|uniref:C-type cytochrome n=1 Tax=Marinobacterium weihaiense TaxID=2851016 RepID=A0ABS6MBT5_9GAMM|nr:di-heme oxidoredictase family protein [Marinobacterium weihaiense]MBV0933759.1 c-type cytochrome [Marinobacterium weihaiense]
MHHALYGCRRPGLGWLILLLGISQSLPMARADTDRASPGPSVSAAERKAFMRAEPDMPFEQRMTFVLGRAIFEKLWVSSPSSTTASDGLGPLYNARACSRCHINNGRGLPPDEQGSANRNGILVRLGIPGKGHQTPLGVTPEPTYGTQLQTFAVPGLKAEGSIRLEYTYRLVELAGGESVELRQPIYTITDPGYGPLHPQTRLSPRLAPAMIGLGLLELIPAADILAREDPDDADDDGISGRANRVFHPDHDRPQLGRFGWKAGQPDLRLQNAGALNTDIGISNPDYPAPAGDCTVAQLDCRQAPNGNTEAQGGHEASAEMMAVLLFYTQHLAVPPQRRAEHPEVQAGAQLFTELGCSRCHTPTQQTGQAPDRPALSNRTIHPYTDLLLHDMGAALADHRPEFAANGREWRTPPLWGLGLHRTVSGERALLHDGRARTLAEAILWHGGEAADSREYFRQLPSQQRDQLIAFLESL